MENDNIFYEQWLNDLQVTVDSLREQRDEDRTRIAELQKQVDMYRSMIDRMKQVIDKGDYL
jgi:peptidoglycan hydrolase CwlO-like protein